jgi:hypothetical protein
LESRLLIEGTELHDDNFAYYIFIKSSLVFDMATFCGK